MSSFGKEGQQGVCGSSSVGLNLANAVKETGFWSYIHVLYGVCVCGVQKTLLPTATSTYCLFDGGLWPWDSTDLSEEGLSGVPCT